MVDVKFSLPEAIVLCGGKGERLRPITNDIPKPLVRINDKPILHYVVSHLIKHQIRKIHIASGYKADLIEDYFKNNNYDAEIQLHNAGDVDIIRRIQNVWLSTKKDVLVLYGDTISNVDISSLVRLHHDTGREVTMTVWPLKVAYGLVEIGPGQRVESFLEKPTLDKWINIGYFYINRAFGDTLFAHDRFVTFLESMVSNKAMSAFRHTGIHITVNTLSELEEAQRNIHSVLEGDER